MRPGAGVSDVDDEQRVKLYEALVDAFAQDLPGLVRMLQYRAKWEPGDLPNVATRGAADVVYTVVEFARQQGGENDLLEAAIDARPRNPKLRALAELVNLGVLAPPNAAVLQREATLGLPNVAVEVWRQKLGEIEGRVCRIELRKKDGTWAAQGTGFLIGPDLVVTAHHVLLEVIPDPARPADAKPYQPTDVRVRFDYRATPAGVEVRKGTPVLLNTTGGTAYPGAAGAMRYPWLVDSAPHSAVDLLADPGGRVPKSDELDFAVLRLAESIGRLPVNPKGTNAPGDPSEERRGWVTVPTDAAGLTPPGSVFIVQHPSGRPMELALGGNGLLGLNKNGTRVRYRTNTENASSGSPCFDLNWNLIALHHAGDPDYALAHTPQWNQGIPFHLISARLIARQFGSLLNQPQ